MYELADRDLLERWGHGDNGAGAALLMRHRRALYGFLCRRTTRDLDDVAQQTLLACIERRDSYRGEASFRTFMLKIARYQIYAQYRRRCNAEDCDVATLPCAERSPNQQLASEQVLRSVTLALQRLPDMFREVLHLVYFEGLRGPEVADKLGIPEPTVRSRTRRALLHLRREVDALSRGRAHWHGEAVT
jgi:RNA polymerase sigma factor (sigma-70 family)